MNDNEGEKSFQPDSEIKFDLEQFRSELTQKTEEFAKKKYEDSGSAEIQELYNELLDKCAQALHSATDSEEVLKSIGEILADYKYGRATSFLFGGSSKTDFYRDLVLQVAKKKNEETAK